MRRFHRQMSKIALGAALLLVIAACGPPPAPPSWRFLGVDSTAGTPNTVGATSASVIFGGEAHVFYEAGTTLRHAWFTGKWNYERDFASGAGSSPAVVLFQGKLHVFSTDAAASTLYHSVYTPGVGWVKNAVIDAGGGGTPAAMVSDGQLHVFYGAGGDLRHAWSTNGTAFATETLDGSGTGGQSSDTVATSGVSVASWNGIHVFYGDTTVGTLRHAFYNSGSTVWNLETLDGDGPSPTGRTGDDTGSAPAAVVYGNGLHVFSGRGSTDDGIRHAWYVPVGYGGAWHYEELDGPQSTKPGHTAATTLARGSTLVWNGQLDLFYGDAAAGSLRHAYFVPGHGWGFEDYPSETFAAQSVAPLIVNGQPWTVFGDATPALRVGLYY